MHTSILITSYLISRNCPSLSSPKPNKILYDSSKIFCPIVLLNILEKLIKQVIYE